MTYKLYNSCILLSFLCLLNSCSVLNKTKQSDVDVEPESAPVLNIQEEIPVYRGSEKRINDLIHTQLKVSFNWEEQKMNGEAWLKVKPYAKNTDQLTLDAKSMEILEVSMVNDADNEVLDYDMINIS